MHTITYGTSAVDTIIRGSRTCRMERAFAAMSAPMAHNYMLPDFRRRHRSYDLVKSVHVEAVSADPLGRNPLAAGHSR